MYSSRVFKNTKCLSCTTLRKNCFGVIYGCPLRDLFLSPSSNRKEPDLILFQEDGSELQGLAGALEDPGREDLSVVGAPGPAACTLYLVVERISHDRASALQSRITSEHVCQVPPPQRVCCAQAAGVQRRGIRKAPCRTSHFLSRTPDGITVAMKYLRSCKILHEVHFCAR